MGKGSTIRKGVFRLTSQDSRQIPSQCEKGSDQRFCDQPGVCSGFAAIVGLAASFLAGCYTYAPLGNEPPVLSSEVRIRPAPEFREGLKGVLPGDPGFIKGELLTWDEFGIVVHAVTAGVQYGVRDRSFGQRIVVPWSDVLEVEKRELSRGRTALVVGTGAALAAVILRHLFGGETGGIGGSDPSPSDGDADIITSITIGWEDR